MVARSEDYYLRTVAAGHEEYYTGAGESPGYWLGEGSALLGLSGEVAASDLRAVLAGVSPHGDILTAPGVAAARRVAGFDLTFSAPKSVSLLYGLSDKGTAGTVRAVHADAVTQALRYLERHALHVRRDHGGLRRLGAQGVVAAAFVHRTSRAGDPQLHTHVLVANATLGDDGVWSAPDARLLYVHARTAGALYQSALRAGLGQALGVRFGPVTRGLAELEGIPRSVLRAFSTRRREIEAVMGESGKHSRRAAEIAALATRAPKALDAALSGIGLRQRWLERAIELGLDVTGHRKGPFGPLLGTESWLPAPGTEIERLFEDLAGPDGVTAAASTFERRDVVRSLAEAIGGGADFERVEGLAERFLGRGDVIELGTMGRGAEMRQTTTELLAVERALLERAERLGSANRGVTDSGALEIALGRFPLLGAEQVAMVRRLTTSGAGVDVVVGKAGAGKTLALAAAQAAWETAGWRVHGTALSARAARALHDGAGIDSDTLARLQTRITSGSLRLHRNDVIVLDEAGMVGTRQLAHLLVATEAAGAKLVLVGDPAQLPEIEAGGTLAALVKRLGASELTENRRQGESWERFALDALRHARADVALATYERAGQVHLAPHLSEARAELTRRWAESRGAGHQPLMLAVERAEVAALNDAARTLLRSGGSLGDDVVEMDGRGFALGEEVVCLRNDRRIDVLNGTTGTVVRCVGASLVISTTDGERVLPQPYLEAGHLGYAYALTIHKAQGLTVERAFVLATPGLTQEAGYVAMSRAQAGTELFVALEGDEGSGHDPRRAELADALGETRRRLGTSRAKQLAIDQLDPDSTGAPRNGDGASSRSAVTPMAASHPQVSASYRVEVGTRGVGECGHGRTAEHGPGPRVVRARSSQFTRSVTELRATLERLRLAAEIAARFPAQEREARGRDRGRGR
jgi:conjugative relaxase-like TrwC/TraI family protein